MKALYAGSFDPITDGHVDILQQAKMIFDILVRGLRAISDFEAEFQMTLLNRRSIGYKNTYGINTVLFIPDESRVYLSSSVIKGIAQMCGNISHFVPKEVGEALKNKFGEEIA